MSRGDASEEKKNYLPLAGSLLLLYYNAPQKITPYPRPYVLDFKIERTVRAELQRPESPEPIAGDETIRELRAQRLSYPLGEAARQAALEAEVTGDMSAVPGVVAGSSQAWAT